MGTTLRSVVSMAGDGSGMAGQNIISSGVGFIMASPLEVLPMAHGGNSMGGRDMQLYWQQW